MDTVRTCRKCGQTKAESEFPLVQDGRGYVYRRYQCTDCYNAGRRRGKKPAHKPKSFNKRVYFARVLAGLKLER